MTTVTKKVTTLKAPKAPKTAAKTVKAAKPAKATAPKVKVAKAPKVKAPTDSVKKAQVKTIVGQFGKLLEKLNKLSA